MNLQIFGIPHFYIHVHVFVKSMITLLAEFHVLTSMESCLFLTVFIQDYTATINQACSGSDVEDSKLKTTWLIILI